MMVAATCWLFLHLHELINGKPILQFGVDFLDIKFVLLISLAALFALAA